MANRLRCIKYLVLVLFLSFSSQINICGAASLEDNKQNVEMIEQLAETICPKIPLAGKSEKIELTGEVKTELNKFLKKIANIGIGGSAKIIDNNYEGIIQEELSSALEKNTNCRLEVFRVMQKNLQITVSNECKISDIDIQFPLEDQEILINAQRRKTNIFATITYNCSDSKKLTLPEFLEKEKIEIKCYSSNAKTGRPNPLSNKKTTSKIAKLNQNTKPVDFKYNFYCSDVGMGDPYAVTDAIGTPFDGMVFSLAIKAFSKEKYTELGSSNVVNVIRKVK